MTEMKLFMRSIMLPVFFLLLLAGCGTPLPHPLLKEDQGPVKIGVVMPLSGQNKLFGDRTMNGIQLALDELNAGYGIDRRRIALEVRDNESTPGGTRRALSELAASGIHGVVLGYNTSDVAAAVNDLKAYRIPGVIPLATGDELTDNNPYLIRTCFTDSQQGHAIAAYLWYWKKLMRLGIITSLEDEAYYSRSIARETAEWFSSLGGVVVGSGEFRENDTTSLRETLLNLISNGPQAILVPVHTMKAAEIVRLLRELGFRGLLIGPDSWDEEVFLRNCGPEPGECAYTAFYSPDNISQENKLFRNSFRKRYLYFPESCEAQGYDSLKILAATLGGADTLEKFKANIATIRNYTGATGIYTLQPRGGIDRTIYINTIRPVGEGRPFPSSRPGRGFLYSRLQEFEN